MYFGDLNVDWDNIKISLNAIGFGKKRLYSSDSIWTLVVLLLSLLLLLLLLLIFRFHK
jgi:hypothetical protein